MDVAGLRRHLRGGPIHYLTSIWSGGPTLLGWLLGLVVVYRLWRGSRPAWLATVVLRAVYLVVLVIGPPVPHSGNGGPGCARAGPPFLHELSAIAGKRKWRTQRCSERPRTSRKAP